MTNQVDLFPRPRRVVWGEGTAPLDTAVSEHADPALPAEGYRLTVAEDGIDLRYADDNGRRYGQQTLGQLRAEDGMNMVEVEDHPDIAVRGHMLDISRDRVPTRETLTLLVERLAACRYNHLQLYTEHTFAYTGHDVVWAEASPMTADDMGWLDARCADHGIELAGNQNTFGHAERWLRHDAYRDRAETPEGFDRMGTTLPPGSLAPTADNADFAVGLVRELMQSITSSRVNIGCDEVWELGKGRSSEAVAERGKTAVFVEHLRRIAEPLLADGLEVLFWADMLESDLEIGRDLAAAGAVAIVWGYSAPIDADPDSIDLSGLPDDIREVAEDYLRFAARGFGPRLERFAASGFRTWVAPGTSGWNSFVGRHTNARANILDAVDAAVAHGAEGLLNTEWGDNGHMQPPFATLPALAYGGATSWCRTANGDMPDADLAAAIDRHLLVDPGGGLAVALVELATIEDTLGVSAINGAPFFYSWISTGFLSRVGTPSGAELDAALQAVDRAEQLIDRAHPGVVDGYQLLDETRLSAAMVRHGLERLGGRDQSAAEVDELKRRFRDNWLARSRPGGLDDSLARMTTR